MQDNAGNNDNKVFMSHTPYMGDMKYTLSISREKIDNLNLDISLTSSDVQLVKKVAVTDVNDAFCCLLLATLKYCQKTL